MGRTLDFGQFEIGQFDFGQLTEVEIGPSRNGPKSNSPVRLSACVCSLGVVLVSVVCVGFTVVVPRTAPPQDCPLPLLPPSPNTPPLSPSTGPPFTEPLRRTSQNFALFFPPPPQISFFLLSGESLRGIVAAVHGRDHQSARLGFILCEPWRPEGRRGFTQIPGSPNAL